MGIWASTHIVALLLLSLGTSLATKQNSVLQLPDAPPVRPLLTREGRPPSITHRHGSLALRLSCPIQACLILQKETCPSGFQDKQVTHLDLRASCKAPGKTRGREDLENRPSCCLPVTKWQTLNHTVGHFGQWPRV